MNDPRTSPRGEELSIDEARQLLETQNEELIVQQKQLLAATDQLEILNEKLKLDDPMKDEFVSMVVHEIRNPLASVSQAIEVARDLGGAELPGKTRTYLDMAKRNVGRLNRILSDLLDLAKMESGRLGVELDAVAPLDAMREAALYYQGEAEQAQVAIDVQTSDLPPVLADSNRITQVLGNLISNAIKFSPAGGCVMVKAEAASAHVVFSVADQGKGIAREFHEVIFEKYRQLSSYQGGGRRGTGLGLPICRHLVRLQGGTIGVESEPGKGARFFFTIPLYSVAGRLAGLTASLIESPPAATAWRLDLAGEAEAWKPALPAIKDAASERDRCVADPARGRIWVLASDPERTERQLKKAIAAGSVRATLHRVDIPIPADASSLAAIIDRD